MRPHGSPTDLANIPAASAPPGFTSNLEDPVTKNTTGSITITIILMIFSTAFLAIRVYTKAFLARIFGVDDVMIIIAWVLSMFVQISIVYYMSVKIIGVHIWDISVADFKSLARITAVDSVVYLVVMGLCKWSILLFYLKLSRERWFTYSIYATMALVFGYCFSLACSLIFACTPLKRVWDVTITEGHCVNQGKIYLATAGLNAATDVIMLALPMPMIKKLQVPFRQKVGLVGIFAVGSFTMVTSIVRLCLMPPLVKATDQSWHITSPATWINIEGNLVVICGCLPILRLFLKHVAPHLIGESSYGSNSRNTPNKQRQDTIGSSELSNLSKNKRSMRSYSRMNETDILATEAGCDDGSETVIIETSDKSNIAVGEIDVERRERHDSSGDQPLSPTPYSQLAIGNDRRSTAPKTV